MGVELTTEKKLNIIIPCYNESRYVGLVLEEVGRISIMGWEVRVIIVDDGSTDGTGAIVDEYCSRNPRWILVRHERNSGKGSAVRSAFQELRGGVCVIQDADLEYSISELVDLVRAYEIHGGAIYGSRNIRRNPTSSKLFYWGGRATTAFANLCFGLHLSDMNTCYKLFPSSAALKMDIRSCGFDVDAEITAKLARLGVAIREVAVTYSPRSKQEGKKISVRDGVRQVMAMARCLSWKPDGK